MMWLLTLLQSSNEAERAAREAAERAIEAGEEMAEAGSLYLNALEAAQAPAHINEFVYLISIFLLAIFIGYYVVWSVTPALHTPLMSVTNAISSVVIVGALIAVGAEVVDGGGWSRWLGLGAVTLASVNIFGGFLVTQRMLAMYKKKER